jgi:hypothetical protein
MLRIYKEKVEFIFFSPFLSLIVVVTVDVDFIRQRGSRTLDSSRDCEIAPG